MTAMVKEVGFDKDGISKSEAHGTILEIEEQLLLIDQKLKVNVDREVWLQFRNEMQQIDYTKKAINKLKTNAE